MSFRELDKERFGGVVPIDLVTVVREKAARERRSLSEAMTIALAQWVHDDPRKYGIEASPRHRRETAAAS